MCGYSVETVSLKKKPQMSTVLDIGTIRRVSYAPAPCLSVRLSVACLDITRERIGLESPKLGAWKPIIRVFSEPI